jgi:hypothetical protein
VEFVEKTGVDALAIAIGTSHGAYKFSKKPTGEVLKMDRLIEIHQRLPETHLVMHGSSSVPKELQDIINQYGGKLRPTFGVPVEEIQLGIKNGVRKINVDTDNRLAITGAIRKVFAETPEKFDPRDYLKPARDAMKKVVAQRMTQFGQAGHAGDYRHRVKRWPTAPPESSSFLTRRAGRASAGNSFQIGRLNKTRLPTLLVLLAAAILHPRSRPRRSGSDNRGVSTFEMPCASSANPPLSLGPADLHRDTLPAVFIASYPGGFSVVVSNRKVVELRFTQPGFVFLEKLQVGSPLEDVLALAPPLSIVKIESFSEATADGVLYQDIGGQVGYCYYSRPDLGARFFFQERKISGLYLVPKRVLRELVPRFNPNSTEPFQVDLRGRDLAALDLRDRLDDLLNASFDDKTVWPPADKRPADFDPWKILALGKLAGLEV